MNSSERKNLEDQAQMAAASQVIPLFSQRGAFKTLRNLYGEPYVDWQLVQEKHDRTEDGHFSDITIKPTGREELTVRFQVRDKNDPIGLSTQRAFPVRVVETEDVYLEDRYGIPKRDWNIEGQKLIKEDSRLYDQVTIQKKDGSKVVNYFVLDPQSSEFRTLYQHHFPATDSVRSTRRPKFIDSPHVEPNPEGGYRLKPGAPKEVVEEFERYQKVSEAVTINHTARNFHGLLFDSFGWKEKNASENQVLFESPEEGAVLAVLYMPKEKLPPIHDLQKLRDETRSYAASVGGGLISAEQRELAGRPGIETIDKRPQEKSGMAYTGTLAFEAGDHGFMVSIRFYELGMTGAREATVLAALESQGKVKADPGSNKIAGWQADPYDPSFEEGVLKNLSESEEYDRKFPNHPLSKIRTWLPRLATSLMLENK